MRVRILLAGLALVVLVAVGGTVYQAVTDCDQICETNRRTATILDRYERSGDPTELLDHLDRQGDASYSATSFTLLEWGNDHPLLATQLLEDVPPDSQDRLIESLRYASEQSGDEVTFRLPDR